ncbi:MAG: FtsX-like permease family protein [Bryobacterales bacterium]|nr:FtsX-like permease family protein [Bryobacterales bacterium]
MAFSSLDRKGLRDLWGMKGQAGAIALVLASGVATFAMSVSTLDTLKVSQADFYRGFAFADVFAQLKRAPESVALRIAEIPGVDRLETRVMAAATLDLPDYEYPVSGQIVSMPERLNRLYLRRGREPDPTRDNEVLLHEAFAIAHGFQPGDSLAAIINGRWRRLRVVGIALSPEFIYQLAPGAQIPDFKSFGILWMPRKPLATAYDVDGAFNSLSLTLAADARADDVIANLDDLLARYGGLGAFSREDQISHRFLAEEFKQLENMATMFPLIFLGVAAFLLNVVVGRLVATQREQVAILKAFGYSNAAVVLHYIKMIVVVVVAGSALGIALGMWLGQGLSAMYVEFYRFPRLIYHLRPEVGVIAVVISAAAAVAGTVFSVARAAALPPAEAMQPAKPPKYRRSVIELLGLGRRLAQPTRMIIRNIERRPVKSLLSVVGISFACAILVLGGFFRDSFDFMIDVQFRVSQLEDLSVTLVDATSAHALYSLASMDGVQHVEPYRSVPARLRFEHRTYRTAVQGMMPGGRLRRLLDAELRPIDLPTEGVILTDHLAGLLGIHPGDMLTVEVLEGNRPVRQVPVAGVVSEWVGVSAYMQLPALNRMMREGRAISGAHMAADEDRQLGLFAELKRIPRVAGASVRMKSLRDFYEIMARQVLVFALVNTLMAGTIAVGIVYNSARISLSERARELASLRVLGLTRGEISYILLGELALLTVVSLPLGCAIGAGLSQLMIEGLQTDLYRVPLVISPWTYSFSATVVCVAAFFSALLVRRKLDHLDLVAVLKTKE